MAQAIEQHIRSEDKVLSRSYMDLEPEVCDLNHMTQIATNLVEDYLNDIHRGHPLNEKTWERVMFAIYQANRMARDLCDQYYAAFPKFH